MRYAPKNISMEIMIMIDTLVAMRWMDGQHYGNEPFLALWNGTIVWAQYCTSQRRYWLSMGDFITIKLPRNKEKFFTHWMALPLKPVLVTANLLPHGFGYEEIISNGSGI